MISAPANFTTANAALAKKPIYLIVITGYAPQFTNVATGLAHQNPYIEDIQDLVLTVDDLNGGAQLTQLVFTLSDVGQLITKAFPSTTFEGKKVVLSSGFVGMAQADFITMFTGVIDQVDSANDNASYTFTCSDDKGVLDRAVYTVGDSGKPTDSNHLRTLLGHPLDMVASLLQTELGIAAGDIDLAKLIRYRDGIFAGVSFKFLIDIPPTARDFIQNELMKPLGGYMWVNNLGQIKFNFFYPESAAPVFTVDKNVMTRVPEAEQSSLINQVNFRFDRDSNNKFLAETVQTYGPSVAKYGLYGQTVVESQGMRSSLQGSFISAVTAQLIFIRYGNKNLKFETNPVEMLWTACVLEPGDIVSLTSKKLPNRAAGTMGVTGALFEVLSRTYNFQACVVTVTMVDVSAFGTFGTFLIAPNGEADYAAASTADKAKYMFLCDDVDNDYSNEAPFNPLG